MFTEMIEALHRSQMVDPVGLKKRFDFALTKKMAVVKLPRALWVRDPKINPRSDHLLWAALLLLDRDRIDLALGVLEAERQEIFRAAGSRGAEDLPAAVESIIAGLLGQMPDPVRREEFARELRRVIPEWMGTGDKKH
jgi:hypothetical protein